MATFTKCHFWGLSLCCPMSVSGGEHFPVVRGSARSQDGPYAAQVIMSAFWPGMPVSLEVRPESAWSPAGSPVR